MKTLAATFALFATLLALAPPLAAADLWIGTWVQRNQPITMIIEPNGASGLKITYRVKTASNETVMVVESAMNGERRATPPEPELLMPVICLMRRVEP